MLLEFVAMFFECPVEAFSSLSGSSVAEFHIFIAVLLRFDRPAFQCFFNRLAFTSIYGCRDWCHILWTIDDVCGLFLELRGQIFEFKFML